jgi:hypothetical protein
VSGGVKISAIVDRNPAMASALRICFQMHIGTMLLRRGLVLENAFFLSFPVNAKE